MGDRLADSRARRRSEKGGKAEVLPERPDQVGNRRKIDRESQPRFPAHIRCPGASRHDRYPKRWRTATLVASQRPSAMAIRAQPRDRPTTSRAAELAMSATSVIAASAAAASVRTPSPRRAGLSRRRATRSFSTPQHRQHQRVRSRRWRSRTPSTRDASRPSTHERLRPRRRSRRASIATMTHVCARRSRCSAATGSVRSFRNLHTSTTEADESSSAFRANPASARLPVVSPTTNASHSDNSIPDDGEVREAESGTDERVTLKVSSRA